MPHPADGGMGFLNETRNDWEKSNWDPAIGGSNSRSPSR